MFLVANGISFLGSKATETWSWPFTNI